MLHVIIHRGHLQVPLISCFNTSGFLQSRHSIQLNLKEELATYNKAIVMMTAQSTIRIVARSTRSSIRSIQRVSASDTAVLYRSRTQQASKASYSPLNLPTLTQLPRHLHVSRQLRGLMPDSSDPPAREAEEHDQAIARTELSAEDYEVCANQFMDKLYAKLEARQDEKADLDVDYSVCRHRHRRRLRSLNSYPSICSLTLANVTPGWSTRVYDIDGDLRREQTAAE